MGKGNHGIPNAYPSATPYSLTEPKLDYEQEI